MDEEVIDAQALIGKKITPSEAMRLALAEGVKGTGFVSPNPLVGCAIVDREHRLLAVGHHVRVGGDHAEVTALKKIRDQNSVEGSHIYVTLEPCAHQGRTPSCARTIAPLKPASVTYAVEDPNPLVSGQGAAILREAGVDARLLTEREQIEDRLELTAEAEELAEIFLHNQRAKEIFVAIKVATSLDGQMAMADGESQWITGETARRHAHSVRARYDAVMVGAKTLINDDPTLNVRLPGYKNHVNKVVILDPKGETLERIKTSNLAKVRPAENVIVIVGTGASGIGDRCRFISVPLDQYGQFILDTLLLSLKTEAGIASVMIEGGAATFGAFLAEKRSHRVHAYLAPILIGAGGGLAWTRDFKVPRLADAIRLTRVKTEVLGCDVYVSGRLK